MGAWSLVLTEAVIILVLLGWLVVLLRRRRHSVGESRDQAMLETLYLVNHSLPYLRHGLTPHTAARTVKLIYDFLRPTAVALVGEGEILAFVGAGSDHHRPGTRALTQVTQEVLRSGRPIVAPHREAIGCSKPDCPLQSAIVAPLRVRGRTVGCLKIYDDGSHTLTPARIRIADSLARAMSTQMELAELDRQTERLARAELAALQAQISPHFIYNMLNTIAAFIRTDPERAHELLVDFADFTRRAFKRRSGFAPLADELEYVHQYLTLEKARYGERLEVVYRIDPEVLPVSVPVLILQPLVENAIRHGISRKVGPGRVVITAEDRGNEVLVTVSDNGAGMTSAEVEQALREAPRRGLGLANVSERLKSLYGPERGLEIESAPGEGTAIRFRVPKFHAGVAVVKG
ncbi:MAG: hypothetical protein KatS3mg061_1757 [Dehalococcoidia bacterium]|nr:MAG: hypothetical protein KatS3mg061_1757 [Dehalococcoidia bacterium]